MWIQRQEESFCKTADADADADAFFSRTSVLAFSLEGREATLGSEAARCSAGCVAICDVKVEHPERKLCPHSHIRVARFGQ